MKYHTYLLADIITHNTCFLPGTQINLANGTYKNIEDIQIGDIVKVFKQNTNQLDNIPVNKIQNIIQDNIYEIQLENGETLISTDNQLILLKDNIWSTISGLNSHGENYKTLETGDYITKLNENGELQDYKIINIIPVEGQYVMINFGDNIPAGIKFTLSDGTTKNIQDLKTGDTILLFDVEQTNPSYNKYPNNYERNLIMIMPQYYYQDKKQYFQKLNNDPDLNNNLSKWSITEIEKQNQQGFYIINNGSIIIDNDQLVFVQKTDGNLTWINTKTEPPEIGDTIQTDYGTWETIQNISYRQNNYTTYTINVTKQDPSNKTLTLEYILINDETPIYTESYKYLQIEKENNYNNIGTIEDAPVTRVQSKLHEDVCELRLENGKILYPTANHPFLTKEKGWATIDGLDEQQLGSLKLEIGDHVYQMSSNGSLQEIRVIDIIPMQGKYLTYTLVDMKYGTFLAEDIVTHNTAPTITSASISNMDDTDNCYAEKKAYNFVAVVNDVDSAADISAVYITGKQGTTTRFRYKQQIL